MMELPIGLSARDFNSKNSREALINMLAETDNSGNFIYAKRASGLTAFASLTTAGVRSNIHYNSGYFYVVAGSVLFRFDDAGTVTNLGTVGGSGRAHIVSNGKPGGNQVCITNGSGQAYIYVTSLTQITDSDFRPSSSVAVLNERFWFAEDGTNTIFCSEISDGLSYDPLSFGAAEWKPDNVVVVVAKKSALWALGERTLEYFQTSDSTTFPIRAVRGASYERGILARSSFAETSEYFAFFADDSTVQLVRDTEMIEISDLELELKIRGDGTPMNPGFAKESLTGALGFFSEGPTHTSYYLTFPNENYTWVYDIETGLSHTRKSGELAFRGAGSATRDNVIYMGDRLTTDIWKLDPDATLEGTETLKATMRCPAISFDRDVTIPLIVVDMEVGQTESATDEPVVTVRYSKNGGASWVNHSDVSVGKSGQRQKKVKLRSFGRVAAYDDFVLELSMSEQNRFQIYGGKVYESLSY